MTAIGGELERGIYSLAEAARITRLESRRIRRWLAGYDYVGQDGVKRYSGPVLQREHADNALTFMDLVEVMFVRAFLRAGVTMPRVRIMHTDAHAEFHARHPFAVKRFETDGTSLFYRFVHEGKARLEDRWTMQQVERVVFNPLLRKIEFSDVTSEARRFWPMGREVPVVLDPKNSFGEATVARSFVPTRVLHNAHRAGDSRIRIARWFKVEPDEVDAATAYEKAIAQPLHAA